MNALVKVSGLRVTARNDLDERGRAPWRDPGKRHDGADPVRARASLHAQPAGGDRAGGTIPCYHSVATLRDMQTPLGVIEGP
jgi:hypothetical protein